MRRRVPDSILDRSYCPKCGKAVLDLIYEIHVVRCKGKVNFDWSSLGFDNEEGDEYDYSSLPSFEIPKTKRCPNSGEEVPKNLYYVHTLTCKKEEATYRFPSFDFAGNDDDEEWSPYNYLRNKRCPKCDEEIPESTYDFHTAICRGKYKRCPKCGEEYSEDLYYLHTLTCKKEEDPTYNYRIEETSSNSILDRALKHDLETFGTSNIVRLYEKPIDYSGSSFTTVPLKLTEYTGELVLSTSLERELSRTISDVSLPSFGESLIKNAVSSIPSAGISFIYGEPTSARDELGLSGLAGLAALVMGGPVAALTVLGFGFLKSILRWIFG